jgi:hypothetical protein
MSTHPPEVVTDDALDRALDALVAVEPSPRLAARVRATIAAQPPPRWGWSRYGSAPGGLVLATAAALVIAVFAVIAPQRQQPVVADLARTEGANAAAFAPRANTEMPAAPAPPAAAAVARRAAATARVAARRVIDDVQIEPNEAAVLRRLFEGGGVIAETAELTTPAPIAQDLVIPLISIDTLTADIGPEGARQ